MHSCNNVGGDWPLYTEAGEVWCLLGDLFDLAYFFLSSPACLALAGDGGFVGKVVHSCNEGEQGEGFSFKFS